VVRDLEVALVAARDERDVIEARYQRALERYPDLADA
jgi:hypothetical protein